MIFSSTSTSFSHDNWLEGENLGSRSTGCMCYLPVKRCHYIGLKKNLDKSNQADNVYVKTMLNEA